MNQNLVTDLITTQNMGACTPVHEEIMLQQYYIHAAKMIVLLQEIELVFKPHPKDHDPETVAQQTRYIKTTANASGESTY